MNNQTDMDRAIINAINSWDVICFKRCVKTYEAKLTD